MNIMNIIYLDFDGVTHPFGCGEWKEFCNLPLIEKTIEPFIKEKNLKIVISSRWRTHYPIKSLKNIFSDDIKNIIIGVTPVISFSAGFESKYFRSNEIEESLKILKPGNFIIIDDAQEAIKPELWKYCIITDPEKGFTSKSRNMLIDKLRKL